MFEERVDISGVTADFIDGVLILNFEDKATNTMYKFMFNVKNTDELRNFLMDNQ